MNIFCSDVFFIFHNSKFNEIYFSFLKNKKHSFHNQKEEHFHIGHFEENLKTVVFYI